MEYWPAISLKTPAAELLRDPLPYEVSMKLGTSSESLNRILEERWSEPWRHYHGIGHFLDGLKKLQGAARELPLEQQQQLTVAWWFHDAVWVPGAEHNEYASTKLAEARLHEYSFSEDFVLNVLDLILNTEHHHPEIGTQIEGLSDLMCDVDLSRFAAPPETVAEDREMLVAELGIREGTKEVLGKLHAFVKELIKRRRPLYQSPQFAKYNAAAEANIKLILSGEIDEL